MSETSSFSNSKIIEESSLNNENKKHDRGLDHHHDHHRSFSHPVSHSIDFGEFVSLFPFCLKICLRCQTP